MLDPAASRESVGRSQLRAFPEAGIVVARRVLRKRSQELRAQLDGTRATRVEGTWALVV
jgi:hypothetical protein